MTHKANDKLKYAAWYCNNEREKKYLVRFVNKCRAIRLSRREKKTYCPGCNEYLGCYEACWNRKPIEDVPGGMP